MLTHTAPPPALPPSGTQTHEQSGSPGAPSEDMGRWVVGRTPEDARAAAAKKYPGREFTLTQDDDVLDTW
jgi:valyl-tRNA synthetase